MTRILFLDIDGPLIPGRAYDMPGQTRPIVTNFDPCAVGMINNACRKQKRKIVLHTSWIRTGFWQIGVDGPGDVHDHCIAQGIDADLFHEDAYCDRDVSWRYHRISNWLGTHPEVTDYVILDDVPPDEDWPYKKHFLWIDFDNGISMKNYRQLLDGDWSG